MDSLAAYSDGKTIHCLFAGCKNNAWDNIQYYLAAATPDFGKRTAWVIDTPFSSLRSDGNISVGIAESAGSMLLAIENRNDYQAGQQDSSQGLYVLTAQSGLNGGIPTRLSGDDTLQLAGVEIAADSGFVAYSDGTTLNVAVNNDLTAPAAWHILELTRQTEIIQAKLISTATMLYCICEAPYGVQNPGGALAQSNGKPGIYIFSCPVSTAGDVKRWKHSLVLDVPQSESSFLVDAADINGRLNLVWKEYDRFGKPDCYYLLQSDGSIPSGPTSWRRSLIWNGEGRICDLADIGGKPAVVILNTSIVYEHDGDQGYSKQQIIYGTAKKIDPKGMSDWKFHVVLGKGARWQYVQPTIWQMAPPSLMLIIVLLIIGSTVAFRKSRRHLSSSA